MATAKKGKGENVEFNRLKLDINEGNPQNLYVFFGEEDYLKSHYLDRLRELCAGMFDQFSTTTLEGERLNANDLVDAIDSPPMGSDRKLVIVRDCPLMPPQGELKELLHEILSELPDYICLVFYFDTLELSPDKRLGIYKTIAKYGHFVDFQHASTAELVPWLMRRFKSFGKMIDRVQCEHMLFTCGTSMTNLATEVDKIAAGTRGEQITKQDIDKLASRVLEADIFALTDRLMESDHTAAMLILRDLIDARNAPVAILAAIVRQMQRIYAAKLASESGRGERYLTDLFGFSSTYPAQLALRASRRMSLEKLRKIQLMCLNSDLELKSSIGDDRRTLELLILGIAKGSV